MRRSYYKINTLRHNWFHRDRETGWALGLGFATFAFGAERDFQIKNEASGKGETILHKNG